MKVMRLFLLTLLLGASALAQKSEEILPGEIVQAKYVYVTPWEGNIYTATPEDRAAVARIESAIREWGKYSLTTTPNNADLILVVRAGRTGSAQVGKRLPGSTDARGEIGPAEDLIEVYRGGWFQNRSQSWLWRTMAKDGLQDMSLFQKFRRAVEEAERNLSKK